MEVTSYLMLLNFSGLKKIDLNSKRNSSKQFKCLLLSPTEIFVEFWWKIPSFIFDPNSDKKIRWLCFRKISDRNSGIKISRLSVVFLNWKSWYLTTDNMSSEFFKNSYRIKANLHWILHEFQSEFRS